VADSASGKTPAQEAALRPLQVLADEERDKYEAARKEYDRAREGTIVGPEPREKRYVTTDCTPQRLTQLLQHDDVLLARDELSGWVGGMDAYSKGAERQAMMQAWSGAQIRVDRRNRDGEAVVRAGFVMNVVGGIQPAMLDAMVADVGAGDDGFCARFLWAWPDVVPAPWSEARLTDQPLLKRQTCSVAYSQPRAV
jgi:hypothetical protein